MDLLIFFVQTYGDYSHSLQMVLVPVIDQKMCKRAMPVVSDRAICAGGVKGDACSGDSGGPFVVNYQLVGIVSWGFECAKKGQYGVYAYVPGQRNWIRKEMNLMTKAANEITKIKSKKKSVRY